MWIHGNILTDFLPAHLRKKDRRLQVRAGKVSRNFQSRVPAPRSRINPARAKKRPYTTVIYVCRLHCSKKESSLYISLLSRNSKLLANLIAKTEHGRKYYHSRLSAEVHAGEISAAGKRNEIKKYRARYLFALTPFLFFFFFFSLTRDARSFSHWESWNVAKTIDPYGFNKNIFVTVSKNI